MRAWHWRSRYTLPGLGTGIAEGGLEGVQCGLESACLAARRVCKEVECSSGGGGGEEEEEEDDSSFSAMFRRAAAAAAGRGEGGGGGGGGGGQSSVGYFGQEVDGIGGVVKRKVQTRVLVGAQVQEFDDERDVDGYMGREREGGDRSWCSWCARIVLGKKDVLLHLE
jgi:hypothetical protein